MKPGSFTNKKLLFFLITYGQSASSRREHYPRRQNYSEIQFHRLIPFALETAGIRRNYVTNLTHAKLVARESAGREMSSHKLDSTDLN